MKTLYILLWILLAVSAGASLWVGSFDSAMLVAFALIALVLLLGGVLWSVIASPQETKLEIFKWDDELNLRKENDDGRKNLRVAYSRDSDNRPD